jgi:hypothetical protein
MKLSKLFSVCVLVATALSSSTTLAESPTNVTGLVGTWNNIDANTSGITKIAVYNSGSNIYFKSWGSCSPTDCVHSTVPAYAHSASVSSNTATGLYAFRNNGFAYTRFAATRVGSYLRVTYYTTFASGDTRKNYTKTEYYLR